MLSIRKNDIVMLADYSHGAVVEVIAAGTTKVYKIKRTNDDEIIYVEDRLVRLSKQCKKNFRYTFFAEVINFIIYTLKIG